MNPGDKVGPWVVGDVFQFPVPSPSRRVVVFHDFYGCDTGCCGHQAVLYEGTTEISKGRFEFAHPYGSSSEEFAKSVAHDAFPGVPLDFQSYEISRD